MARAVKEGLDYFPLDTDFYSNRKIRRLLHSKGALALAVWTVTMSMIYSGKGYYLEFDEDTCFDIGDTLAVSEEKVKDIIEYAIKVGLFDSERFARYQILTSKGIQKQYTDIIKKSNRKHALDTRFFIGCEGDVKSDDTKIGTRPFKSCVRDTEEKFEEMAQKSEEIHLKSEETILKSEEIPQSKIKENKVNKNKINIQSNNTSNLVMSISDIQFLPELITDVEKMTGKTLNSLQIERLEKWVLQHSYELVAYALELSKQEGAVKPLNYANAILEDWVLQGVTTIEQARQVNAQYKAYRKKRYQGHTNQSKPKREQPTPSWMGETQKTLPAGTEPDAERLAQAMADWEAFLEEQGQ